MTDYNTNIYTKEDLLADIDPSRYSTDEQHAISKSREYLYGLQDNTGYVVRMRAFKPDDEEMESWMMGSKIDIYITDPVADPKQRNPMILNRAVRNFEQVLNDEEIGKLIKENAAYNSSQVSKDFTEVFEQYQSRKAFSLALETSLTKKAEQARPKKLKI